MKFVIGKTAKVKLIPRIVFVGTEEFKDTLLSCPVDF